MSRHRFYSFSAANKNDARARNLANVYLAVSANWGNYHRVTEINHLDSSRLVRLFDLINTGTSFEEAARISIEEHKER